MWRSHRPSHSTRPGQETPPDYLQDAGQGKAPRHSREQGPHATAFALLGLPEEKQPPHQRKGSLQRIT
eukprot:4631575-Prorocentrum_lima.AAC.1